MSSHRSSTEGYTIVEVLIFLAVSGMMFISASALISGQQRKTEFVQGVRNMESKMTDLANDVSTGLYNNSNNFSCSATSSSVRPAIAVAASNQQGSNTGCIFIGKVLQLAPNGTNLQGYTEYTVVGKQQKPGSILGSVKDVETLAEASPLAIAPGPSPYSSVPDGRERGSLGGGVTVQSLRYWSGGVRRDASAIGFFSSFGKYIGNQLQSGAQQVSVLAFNGTIDATEASVVTAVDTITATSTSPVVADGGVEVCLKSNGTNQSALLKIGGQNRQQLTNVTFYSNGTCT